jgi:hypothetical protein
MSGYLNRLRVYRLRVFDHFGFFLSDENPTLVTLVSAILGIPIAEKGQGL